MIYEPERLAILVMMTNPQKQIGIMSTLMNARDTINVKKKKKTKHTPLFPDNHLYRHGINAFTYLDSPTLRAIVLFSLLVLLLFCFLLLLLGLKFFFFTFSFGKFMGFIVQPKTISRDLAVKEEEKKISEISVTIGFFEVDVTYFDGVEL